MSVNGSSLSSSSFLVWGFNAWQTMFSPIRGVVGMSLVPSPSLISLVKIALFWVTTERIGRLPSGFFSQRAEAQSKVAIGFSSREIPEKSWRLGEKLEK